jgi:hypothetical protein
MLSPMPNPFDPSLIQWRCQRPEHRTSTDPTPVFLRRGAWAYCEAGKLGTDHDFRPTGGVTRRAIEKRQAVSLTDTETWAPST